MKFDIRTRLESGKAYFECRLPEKDARWTEESLWDIKIWNREEMLVFWGQYPLGQEQPPKGMILHPRLWQGAEDPYLYRVRVALLSGGTCVEEGDKPLALRQFGELPPRGWFLNDRPLEIRAVAYEVPEMEEAASGLHDSMRQMQLRRDLKLIREMGANSICPLGGMPDESFCEICEENGLLIWQDYDEKIPRFWGMAEGLVTLESRIPTDRYYYYKACWSKAPFVYISMDSLTLLSDGTARITVYSNQPKVALYVDGVLFEFRTEGPDFVFEEIPVRQLPLMLTAETRECSMTVTAYPIS